MDDQKWKLLIGTIEAVEKKTSEIKRDINRGFDRINGRIDKVHTRINDVEEDVDVLKTHRTKIVMIGTVVVIVVPLVLRYAL